LPASRAKAKNGAIPLLPIYTCRVWAGITLSFITLLVDSITNIGCFNAKRILMVSSYTVMNRFV
jgi:hypothetical protein